VNRFLIHRHFDQHIARVQLPLHVHFLAILDLDDFLRRNERLPDGTIRLRQPVGGSLTLTAGKRGEGALEPVEIDPAKRGGWRVEEEFINAIRGKERVTHTDLFTGVKYMEWTTAVSRSVREGRAVMLPL